MVLDKKTNVHPVALVQTLKRVAHENNAPIWRDLAKRLEKPARSWAQVNLSRLEYHLPPKTVVVVPGKVLGAGSLSKPMTVAAFAFSASARAKIDAVGGSCLSLSELAKKNPKGANVALMG